MLSYFFEDPKESIIERNLDDSLIEYFYLKKDATIITSPQEVLNGCLLSGNISLVSKNKTYSLKQFDFFLLPPEINILMKTNSKISEKCKLCLYRYKTDQNTNFNLEIKSFSPEEFVARGEFGSKGNITTYRTVWTAFRNSFFMSGFTNIPNKSLRRGVITSVNLEQDEDNDVKVYPHIHPEHPEIYIMCIDHIKYGITQYLISREGDTVCKDLTNGDGVFFPGNLGHSNFARPFYKKLEYVMYMWIIPTFGKTETVNPETLRI